MSTTESSLSQVRKIDNSRLWLPFGTTILVIFLVWVAIWFFRGGSFRLYASVFFGLYFLTRQIWISVLLIGIIQNIAFLPLRFIGFKLATSLREFEDEIEKTSEADQYIVFKQKVKKGDIGVIFYIFNFIVNAIAFFSAGRIFLIDFYTQKLDPSLIYHFIPYPQYPLQGTVFNFPFFKITQTYAVQWRTIFLIWLGITLFFAILKLLWRFLKIFLWKNQKILSIRINYNHLLLYLGGFGGTLFLLSLIFMRNIPTHFQPLLLTADLTHQNTTLNFITAVGTFITVMAAGFKTQSTKAKLAQKAGIPEPIITKVYKDNIKQSLNNGLILGAGAFFITNQIPCAFELSVATFEVLYIISPYTFDKFITSLDKTTHATPAA